MSTIHGENQELFLLVFVLAQVTDEGAGVSGDAVPRLAQRIVEGRQSRFVDREPAQRPQRHPLHLRLAHAEEVADKGDAHERSGQAAQPVG